MPIAYKTEDLYINAIFRVEFSFGGVSILGGFSSAGTPEISIEMNEYRAGDDSPFRRKILGLPTVNDLTFSKGKLFGDVDTLKKLMDLVVYKGGSYVGDVTIYHYHPSGYTKYTLREAVITRIKFDGDLDSMGSDVSIIDMDIAYRYFDVVEEDNPNVYKQVVGATV